MTSLFLDNSYRHYMCMCFNVLRAGININNFIYFSLFPAYNYALTLSFSLHVDKFILSLVKWKYNV